MRLTRYGLELMQAKSCGLSTCLAEPGELCGPNRSGELPYASGPSKMWPHGVHYSRGKTAPPPRSATKDHDSIPRVELTEEEWRVVQVASKLRRAARGA